MRSPIIVYTANYLSPCSRLSSISIVAVFLEVGLPGLSTKPRDLFCLHDKGTIGNHADDNDNDNNTSTNNEKKRRPLFIMRTIVLVLRAIMMMSIVIIINMRMIVRTTVIIMIIYCYLQVSVMVVVILNQMLHQYSLNVYNL